MTDTQDSTQAADAAEPARAGSAPTRRSLIGWGGAGLALGAAAAGGAVAMTRTGNDVDPVAADAGAAVDFHGAYQAGIATPVQDRLHFAAFDVTTTDRAEFVQLLKDWTEAARRMTAGKAVGEGAFGGLPEAPPDDTGEALGLKPSRLTLTVGFGPSLFTKFDLAARLDLQTAPTLFVADGLPLSDERQEERGGDRVGKEKRGRLPDPPEPEDGVECRDLLRRDRQHEEDPRRRPFGAGRLAPLRGQDREEEEEERQSVELALEAGRPDRYGVRQEERRGSPGIGPPPKGEPGEDRRRQYVDRGDERPHQTRE